MLRERHHKMMGMLLLTIQPGLLMAEPLNTTAKTPPWFLSATPRICVAPSRHFLCKMKTELVWEGSEGEGRDVCLKSSQGSNVLSCWANKMAGKIKQEISSDKAVTYSLTDKSTSTILAETIIRIITIPDKPVRKRRRHVWSVL
ncbi:MAG: DUF3019 domain-containing protein [Methylococcales bacterium]|nr:DUF3019 domain-containing protein [Methylococcales bacterium]